MDSKTILTIILFGIALSMDAFAISITDGLIYKDINRKKSIFIASIFGSMQAIMPLIGYWFVEVVEKIVGQAGGEKAGKVASLVVTWIAFILLLLVGGKMLIEGINDVRKPKKEKDKYKSFSFKEVLLYGLLTSIDALAVGVSLHTDPQISTNVTIFLHVSIILVITFVISLIGLFLGGFFNKLLKGKYEISCIIGGIILIGLAIWVITSHYLNI